MSEQTVIYQREWRKTLHGRYRLFVGEAKNRGLFCDLLFDDWQRLIKLPCIYGLYSDTIGIKIGIDRKDNNEGYTLENSVPCCHRHNSIKSNVFTYDEMIDIVSRYTSAKNCNNYLNGGIYGDIK